MIVSNVVNTSRLLVFSLCPFGMQKNADSLSIQLPLSTESIHSNRLHGVHSVFSLLFMRCISVAFSTAHSLSRARSSVMHFLRRACPKS